jgi:hypothetical protein
MIFSSDFHFGFYDMEGERNESIKIKRVNEKITNKNAIKTSEIRREWDN